MLVQWCMKGLAMESDATARAIIDDRRGLLSAWWRDARRIAPEEARDLLTAGSIDRHVNHFDDPDPRTGRPYGSVSPYVSLSCGTVSRDAGRATNNIHSALRTALWFGTAFGERAEAYVYSCWVVVAPRVAIPVEGVAEEVRSLTTYRNYSTYQTEGEVAAKIAVPDNQVRDCQKWEWRSGRPPRLLWVHHNPRFTAPEILTNVNELI
jgi:hypothetical protein